MLTACEAGASTRRGGRVNGRDRAGGRAGANGPAVGRGIGSTMRRDDDGPAVGGGGGVDRVDDAGRWWRDSA